jgi:hypothetical protein
MALDATKARELIGHIRRLAQAAPAGPWKIRASDGYHNPSVHAADGPLFATGNSKARAQRERYAACVYVAAISPPLMEALLDVLDQALADRDVLLRAVDALAAQFEELTNDRPPDP